MFLWFLLFKMGLHTNRKQLQVSYMDYVQAFLYGTLLQ